MAERKMTPDELERFGREQVHHEGVRDSAGPASETDSESKPAPITTPVVVGNPD
jgi:hypothetical protein